MRPATLAEAIRKSSLTATPQEKALPEFLDTLLTWRRTTARQLAAITGPIPSRAEIIELDAFARGAADISRANINLPQVPAGSFGPERFLDHAWHVSAALIVRACASI